jgi:hypothetical protein
MVSAATLVGLYKLNQVDPRLESTRFQRLSLKLRKTGFKIRVFTFNLCRYTLVSAVRGDLAVESAALPAVGLCTLNQVDP